MLLLEYLATVCFYLLLPFYFLERIISGKSGGWKEKFGCVEEISHGSKVIMVHGCSVGEITATENLLKQIKSEFPECKLVVTTSTITGQNVAKIKYFKVADYITFFPFDIHNSVDKFLDKIHPDIVLMMETEIWPTFAGTCRRRNIPIYIINGRISDTSYNSYRLAKFYFKQVLNFYSGIFTQSKEDSQKYISVGADEARVKFMGNLKFGITKTETSVDIGQSGYKILIAGSTHKPENPIIIETYKNLKAENPEWKLIIAPRHLERVKEIETLLKESGINFGYRSKNDKFSEEKDVIILDTLGELKSMYSICDIAYIGGSFNKTGGHNPLEASIYEKPVVSGPSIFNFKDIYSILTKSGSAKVVKTKQELYSVLRDWIKNKESYNVAKSACTKVFDEQKGAADFVTKVISEKI